MDAWRVTPESDGRVLGKEGGNVKEGHCGFSQLRIYMRMERDSKKIVKRLKDEGFELISIAGSHHKFRKGSITVIVPHPKKDLPTGTARAIAKQAGWI
jgi:predicted RNA binding protein YcfA (HicA-like mRNA interferase family)